MNECLLIRKLLNKELLKLKKSWSSLLREIFIVYVTKPVVTMLQDIYFLGREGSFVEGGKQFSEKQNLWFCSICSYTGSLFRRCHVFCPFHGRHISKVGHAV